MKIEDVVVAEFIKRPNRFQGYVKLNGEEIKVAVPNTGRCREILVEGTKVILRKGKNPKRITPYDLIAAYKGNKLINIDSQAPNKVVYEALVNKKIPELREYTIIEREKTYGESRFDFRLTNEDGEVYFLEVKGVTLEENGYCKFPDAPTERGARHLLELVSAKEEGFGAGVMFLIQMDGMKEFSPYDERDPKFGEALRRASSNGVDIFAYQCKICENELTLSDKVSIKL